MHGLVVFVLGGLADGTDEAFVLAGGVDADEIEDFSLVHVAFGALQVAYPYLFELLGVDAHL